MTVRTWDPYQSHSERAAAPQAKPKPSLPPPVQVIEGVPVGTTVHIQDWVGDDPERARAAWRRERGQERPRITLLTHLESVLKHHGVAPEPLPLEAAPVPVDREPTPWQPGPIPVERDPGLFRKEEDEEDDGKDHRRKEPLL